MFFLEENKNIDTISGIISWRAHTHTHTPLTEFEEEIWF